MLEKFQEKIALIAARVLTAELRAIRGVLEVGVDSFRLANGMNPIFDQTLTHAGREEGSEPAPPIESIIAEGDYLSVWILRSLAEEQFIHIGPETDIEKLALERGWISPDGKLLMVSEEAKRELPPEMLRELGVG